MYGPTAFAGFALCLLIITTPTQQIPSYGGYKNCGTIKDCGSDACWCMHITKDEGKCMPRGKEGSLCDPNGSDGVLTCPCRRGLFCNGKPGTGLGECTRIPPAGAGPGLDQRVVKSKMARVFTKVWNFVKYITA